MLSAGRRFGTAVSGEFSKIKCSYYKGAYKYGEKRIVQEK